jgi:hypothetical protein
MKFMRYIIIFLFNFLVLTNLNAQCWSRLGRLDGDSCSTNFAIKDDGTLWAWGINNGIYGNGLTQSSYAPIMVNSDKDWMTVSYNGNFASGVKTDGTLWCWKLEYKQDYSIQTMLPKNLNYGTDWKDVCVNRGGAIALKDNGTLFYIFENSFDYLAIGKDADWKFLRNFYGTTFAVKYDGTLWTYDNSNYTFIKVGKESDFEQVYGDYAIKKDGSLWFYEPKYPYFEGDKNLVSSEKWQSMSSGDGWHGSTYAIKTDGTLWDLVNGDAIQVGKDNNWREVIAGRGHVVALKHDGTIFTWGENDCGQLGNGSIGGQVLTPTIINTFGCLASSNELDLFESAISIFPNPTSNQINLSSNLNISSFQLKDAEGRIVLSRDFQSEDVIDLSFLNSGVYMLEVLFETSVLTKLVVKQ